jgi:hypothetical protein
VALAMFAFGFISPDRAAALAIATIPILATLDLLILPSSLERKAFICFLILGIFAFFVCAI